MTRSISGPRGVEGLGQRDLLQEVLDIGMPARADERGDILSEAPTRPIVAVRKREKTSRLGNVPLTELPGDTSTNSAVNPVVRAPGDVAMRSDQRERQHPDRVRQSIVGEVHQRAAYEQQGTRVPSAEGKRVKERLDLEILVLVGETEECGRTDAARYARASRRKLASVRAVSAHVDIVAVSVRCSLRFARDHGSGWPRRGHRRLGHG